jgi:hypothetical protein
MTLGSNDIQTPSTGGSSRVASALASEPCTIAKIEFMKACGTKTAETVRAMKGIQIKTSMRENSKAEKLMVKEFILGRTEKCSMENGGQGLRRVMAYGRGYSVTPI